MYNLKQEDNTTGIYKILILLGTFYVFINYSYTLLSPIFTLFKISNNVMMFVYGVIQIVIFYKLVHYLKINVWNREKINHNFIWYLIFFVIILYGLIVLPSFILEFFSQQTTTTNAEYLKQTEETLSKFVIFFSTVIVAPITEEYVFRTPLLIKTDKKWQTILILIGTSLFFGSMHHAQNIGELLSYSVSGFLLGLTVLYTNEISMAITLHTTINMLVFLVSNQ